MASSLYPIAQRDGLVVQPLDGELLVNDSETTHLLNPVAASVWQTCDGHHSVADISRHLALDETTVLYALQQLEQKKLVQPNSAGAPFTKPMTRREFLKKGAIAAAAIPVIKTIQLPNPSAPITLCEPCDTPSQCGGCECIAGCCECIP
jgi:hypothetical protein